MRIWNQSKKVFTTPMLLEVCREYLRLKLSKNFVPFPVISREGTKPGGQ